ncbi:DUF2218 domain-containing protein [Planotetraspora kaengkrachanensis]|uniref:DUF2218 domain-containing protein n=1 Tax=Planotetraspora kaengkrachanensis TaxID=575193 RepID=A0A8J3M6M5_9ACTN|nr:DUF2218 domain-containing protein [Planotetraspora kaengkrachanensis]GIG80469.1 hypothetical protein Pka01_35960 [Planotetraspora kaengkrachanensis]
MPSSTAHVATETAARYAKQLASHLGRKVPVEDLPGDGYRLTFPAGEGVLSTEADRLIMRATATDAASLAIVQDVLGRHLERFGQRNELVVNWQEDVS